MKAMPRKKLKRMYDYVGPFSKEGLAPAKKGKEWFHIFRDGTPAYKERFDSVGPFFGGLALAIKDGKSLFIHINGTPH
jgi:hypothetical protein